MKVILIGGRGHLGSRAWRALTKLPDLELVRAGRHARDDGDLSLDITKLDTLTSLREADLVVNASSSHTAAPDRLADYCLERGLTLLETSSDSRVVQRLLERRTRAASGTLVLGAGIFTGLSNLLGAAAVRAEPGCDRLELAVRSSPFSGAGAGTVDLMLDSLRTPAYRMVGGRIEQYSPIERGPNWPGNGSLHPSLLVALAEPAMLHASCGIADVSMYMLPKPAALAPAFLATPRWLLGSTLYRALLWCQFTLLRRLLLRSKPTAIELFARATNTGSGRSTTCALSAPDGMWAAGVAIAAMVNLLAGRRQRQGTYCIDECLELPEVLAAMQAIDPACGALLNVR